MLTTFSFHVLFGVPQSPAMPARSGPPGAGRGGSTKKSKGAALQKVQRDREKREAGIWEACMNILRSWEKMKDARSFARPVHQLFPALDMATYRSFIIQWILKQSDTNSLRVSTRLLRNLPMTSVKFSRTAWHLTHLQINSILWLPICCKSLKECGQKGLFQR